MDFSQPAERERLLAAFSALWAGLSKNREQWQRQLDDSKAYATREGATAVEQSAALLLAGMVLTDVVCRGACEYPEDRQLVDMADHVLATNLRAIDSIFGGDEILTRDVGEPPFCLVLLRELQFANEFFERRFGLRELWGVR